MKWNCVLNRHRLHLWAGEYLLEGDCQRRMILTAVKLSWWFWVHCNVAQKAQQERNEENKHPSPPHPDIFSLLDLIIKIKKWCYFCHDQSKKETNKEKVIISSPFYLESILTEIIYVHSSCHTSFCAYVRMHMVWFMSCFNKNITCLTLQFFIFTL